MTGATEAQVVAARPDASSWVSANAGSGKTRVLTDRVARLLLAGTEPGRILCLTYTKAAAAEMQTRLFRTLGDWAMMPEADLRAALTELGEPGVAIARERLERARTLFARALETPGGLKIQTIHAFCDALLRRFPLEAGVAPQFRVLEDRQAKALRAEVLDALAAAGAPSFAALAPHMSGDDFDPLLQEIAQRRAAFAGPFEPGRLAAALGVNPAAPARPFDLAADETATLRTLVPILARSGVTDRTCGAALAEALRTPDPEDREIKLEAALLTRSFTPRRNFPAAAVRRAHPPLAESLDALVARIVGARAGRLAQSAFEKSSALNVFARVWLEALAARKAGLGLLDFDDLIDGATGLLARPETAAWVLWRLDGGIDHILVDEAQDTSPAQWRVIEALSAEFFAGLGARGTLRTLFVVGDEKQSIYSFQGADPGAFGAMRAQFARMLDDIGTELARCDLLYSFRSARPILELVDTVFAGPAGAGLDGPTRHLPIDADAPGRVELWPFLEKPEKIEESPWDEPVDARPPDDPVDTLAERVASEVRGWLDARLARPGDRHGRALRPGDVLILVQRRGPVFHAVIRALKRAGVPVAGADVLRIGGELAVRDLLAALRVAVTPADDLSLAALLRSPLGGLDEGAVFRLAHPRTGTLWAALGAASPILPVRAMLRDLRAQADFLRPFELLQRVLIRHDGRRAMVGRLGQEAEDGIDALLDQALAYESVEPPTVTGFLAWIDRDEVVVKRRTEDAADEVRVMTVHGAKGLEAPVVILPDTAQRQEGGQPPQILQMAEGAGWRMRVEEAPPAFAAAEAARRARVGEENRRLLYVALTRARSRLIVAGAGRPGPDSWHAIVEGALDGLGAASSVGATGPVRALSHAWSEAAATGPDAASPKPTLAEWARRPPPAPMSDAAPLSPSDLGGAHALVGEGLDEAAARARGAAAHLLLERLPAHARADWPAVALLLVADAAHDLLAEVAAVLEDPALAAIFAPEAMSEVEIVAPLAALDGRRILGRIDRLIVAPDRVLAVDFKTNRVAPPAPHATPEGILRQMGAYAAALGAIYPGREIETAVLWTRTRQLMRLPAALTASALARAARLDRAGGTPYVPSNMS